MGVVLWLIHGYNEQSAPHLLFLKLYLRRGLPRAELMAKNREAVEKPAECEYGNREEGKDESGCI